MILRVAPIIFGFFLLCFITTAAKAADPIAVVQPVSITATPPEISSFVDAPVNNAAHCNTLLKKKKYFKSHEKIAALKNYRQCKSDATLYQLSVFRWQEASLHN